VLALGIVDDELDRGDALGRAMGGRATPARKLGQLCAKVVIDGFVEADPDHAALAQGQPEPLVKADRHMHASADQPAGAIRAPYAPATSAQLLHLVDVLARVDDPTRRPGERQVVRGSQRT
jgi:hypothetical protein